MIAVIKGLLYPPKCIVCGQILDIPLEHSQEEFFCGYCIQGVLEEPQGCYCEEKDQDEGIIVKGLFPYSDNYQRSVLKWKYSGVRKYAKGYGQLMSFMEIPWEEIDALIPVPVSPSRYRKRGFNQALDLAQELSVLTGVPTYDVLERSRNTKPQSECTKKERHSNIKGSIGVNQKVLQSVDKEIKKIVLIDDIYTTGSTAKECAKILRAINGWEIGQIIVLVVTRGM